jgi:hypothetical protein
MRMEQPTYHESEPAVSWRITKHVINSVARPASVRSRDEEDEVGRKPESGAESLRVPVEGLYFLGQPEVKVHGVQHSA